MSINAQTFILGAILFEMVTGRVPFEGDTPFTVGVKHKSEMPQNPKDLNSQIPDDLNRMILKCLEKDKENRYQSAGEVRSEIESILKGIPTTERIVPKKKPLTSKEITIKFGMKKLIVPMVAFVALLAVVGYFLFRGGREPLKIEISRTDQITHASGLEIDPHYGDDAE